MPAAPQGAATARREARHRLFFFIVTEGPPNVPRAFTKYVKGPAPEELPPPPPPAPGKTGPGGYSQGVVTGTEYLTPSNASLPQSPDATAGDGQFTVGKECLSGRTWSVAGYLPSSVTTDHRAVKQGKSWGSTGTTTATDSRGVSAADSRGRIVLRGERPMGAAHDRHTNTAALCQTPPHQTPALHLPLWLH